MEEYKREFIEFLLTSGALKVFGSSSDDRTLKGGRISPWFVDLGDFNDGLSTAALAGFYADAIISSGTSCDVLYGIPEKGIGLAAPVAMAMASKGHNAGWFFSRKDEKKHGEAFHLGQDDRIKALLVGKVPGAEDAIVQLDDVFTTGNAKYEANAFLKSIGRTDLPLLAIAVDRQEVALDSKNAISGYMEKTRTRVISIVNASDIYSLLNERHLISGKAQERLANYLRVYGTEDARAVIGPMLDQDIIPISRSVIPACDVSSLGELETMVEATASVEGIGGYKIGFELGLGHGLPRVVETIRKHTDKPIIYDHQKAATDIPDTGRNFARVCKNAGIDAVILFPQAGPETERAWIYHALDQGLKVIVGGRMTHAAYAQSEGGFITDEGALEMYRIAARAGITHFVVPGNKTQVIRLIKEGIEEEGVMPVFFSPGFVEQGGRLSDAARMAGERFHGIVGRGIYQAADPREAAFGYTRDLRR